MEITDIRVKKVNSEGRLKGIASVTFDNAFVVHDIKVIEGNDDKLFIAMPSRKSKTTGEHKDIAHPINSDTRTMLTDAVIKAYNEAPTPEPKED